MIRLRDVVKTFGTRRVLDGVDLDLAAGEVVLLLGANGAGKTTLLRCILGIIPYAGSIDVGGHDALAEGRAVRRLVGYMPQSDGLHGDLTVLETLRFHAALRAVATPPIDALLQASRLTDAADVRVDEISGGMRQRLGFALALLGDPPVLLLDEPTTSLDGWSREFLVERVAALAAEGKTVLLSTHTQHPTLLRIGRTVFLDGGRIESPQAHAHTCPAPRLIAGTPYLGWMIDSCGRTVGEAR